MLILLTYILFAAVTFVLEQSPKAQSASIQEEDGSVSPAPTANNNNANPLSSHVLDISTGRPGEGIKITLFKQADGQFMKISEQVTNEQGRVSNIVTSEQFTAAIYKLHFETMPYFKKKGLDSFYPFIEIIFQVKNTAEHYHVPIVLSAYGYSTYRGS